MTDKAADASPRPSTPPRRGRRPAGEVRRDVLDATSTLLRDGGFRAVTFERVAAQSGASKTTIYKWWASPGTLAAEAYFDQSAAELAFADSGDVFTDIGRQLRAFVRLIIARGGGRIISELIGAAQTDPEVAAAVSEKYTAPRRRLAVEYFRLATFRGQIRPEVDPDMLVDQLWGACYHRLLIPDAPLDEAFADALVLNALRGAATPEYAATHPGLTPR
ncbi:TetR/AcrR family transcriptional regulator [Brevibacterium oceani]|uniref:TetR/AcrR family transcriptional regulator n=1 Tax=Brevibacterium oceani TaxID=358099 RepID=UPI001B3436F6|nr:TetR/AcrR family transcriptional regulator [Brevibacterium oceani]